MFCSVLSSAISGVEAVAVSVEADVSDGMPLFVMVGDVGPQTREAQDRIRTALKNMGISMPPKRITINLFPGNIRKEGTRFDLPIAAAVLSAMGILPAGGLLDTMLLGELHLDGRIGGVNGVLPGILLARKLGCRICIVPEDNRREALVVEGIRVVSIRSLKDLIKYCHDEDFEETEIDGSRVECSNTGERIDICSAVPDFSDIKGQESVKRASLIAAAGFHNILFTGPPGTGKSMAAARIPGILPPLSLEESLEVSRIYSVAGLLRKEEPLVKIRPFRAPHHSVTVPALCGGGAVPHPGEITLAHRGVLFLDEIAETSARTLDSLRQPLEEHRILISRVSGTYEFPANFLLAAAMNPCPCGYYPNRNRCTCSPKEILNYHRRISQPLLDRIDLRCVVPEPDFEDLRFEGNREMASQSMEMRKKVVRVSEIQRQRYAGTGFYFNSQLPAEHLQKFCVMTPEAENMAARAYKSLPLSVRAYHRVLRMSRTIADLEGDDLIAESHVSEALYYRGQDTGGILNL